MDLIKLFRQQILLPYIVNIAAALTFFLLGLLTSKLSISHNRCILKEFFGNKILTDKFKIVYGMFSRTPAKLPNKLSAGYQKIYTNGSTHKIVKPSSITTQDTLRGISYFLQEFSKFRKKPFDICTDEEALSYHNNTFLCIGGPVSNEISHMALKQKNNIFFKFSIPPELNRRRNASIKSISDNKIFKNKNKRGTDYGIIVKVKNNQCHENYFIVCAGMGALGTSAAIWYLTHYWKQLYNEFKSQEFGILIEANHGKDNMVERIYPNSKLSRHHVINWFMRDIN